MTEIDAASLTHYEYIDVYKLGVYNIIINNLIYLGE